jgi:LysR family glycine cleavage system transcriptional activator
VPTTRVVDLKRDQVDLAVRHGQGSWPGIEAAFLSTETALPVCAAGYLTLAPDEDPLAALRRVRLIVNTRFPDEWEEWARARGLAPPPLVGVIEVEGAKRPCWWRRAGAASPSAAGPWSMTGWRAVRWSPVRAGDPTGAAFYLCRPPDVPPTVGARRLERWLRQLAAAT